MSITIKQLTETDFGLCNQASKLLCESETTVEHFKQFLVQGYLLVALDQQTPVGFLSAYRLPLFQNKVTELFIYEVEVDENYRRQGVGSMMLKYILELAKKEGLECPWVLTNKSNPTAVKFYESLGGKIAEGDELMIEWKNF